MAMVMCEILTCTLTYEGYITNVQIINHTIIAPLVAQHFIVMARIKKHAYCSEIWSVEIM